MSGIRLWLVRPTGPCAGVGAAAGVCCGASLAQLCSHRHWAQGSSSASPAQPCTAPALPQGSTRQGWAALPCRNLPELAKWECLMNAEFLELPELFPFVRAHLLMGERQTSTCQASSYWAPPVRYYGLLPGILQLRASSKHARSGDPSPSQHDTTPDICCWAKTNNILVQPVVPGYEPESSLVKSPFQLWLNLQCATQQLLLLGTWKFMHTLKQEENRYTTGSPLLRCANHFILFGNFCLGRAHKTLPTFTHWNDASSIWPTQSPLIFFITKVTLTTGSLQIPVTIMHFKWCGTSNRG